MSKRTWALCALLLIMVAAFAPAAMAWNLKDDGSGKTIVAIHPSSPLAFYSFSGTGLSPSLIVNAGSVATLFINPDIAGTGAGGVALTIECFAGSGSQASANDWVKFDNVTYTGVFAADRVDLPAGIYRVNVSAITSTGAVVRVDRQ